MKAMGACGMGKVIELIFQRMETSIMKHLLQIALALMALGLAGCADGNYPISGETCAPGDPVQKLDAHDCTVVPAP